MIVQPISKENSCAAIALQATINYGIAQALTTVLLARIGNNCIKTAVLLLRRFHPTLQGQYPPQFHTDFCPIQRKLPEL